MTFWSELGFVFPQFPFIAHSRGWDAEDMLDKNRGIMEKPMQRAGRKANPLDPAEELADRLN